MDKNKEITLPSGATLKITLAPFAEGKALHAAFLEELGSLKVDGEAEAWNLYKDMFCMGFSSKKIDKALEACLKRVLYNNKHIDDQTFEPVEAREDYMVVLLEVAQHNLAPFLKNLSLALSRISESLSNIQKPKS